MGITCSVEQQQQQQLVTVQDGNSTRQQQQESDISPHHVPHTSQRHHAPPLPSRMIGTQMDMAQPPPPPPIIATGAKPLDRSTSSSVGSAAACDQERNGSVSVHLGSMPSTSTAQPMLMRYDDSATFQPPSSPLSKSNPPFGGRVIRATGGGVSQCSLHSASGRVQRHARRGASTMSTGSGDSTNTWTQFTAHDATSAVAATQQRAGEESLWALARFRSDGPLSF
ncbi:Hypothetical protein, putative [Bodo saltans]|uniref:Uncharacterized protein n=1 Tax=Bodo saltans TaxID=75058 RepID=A0A0S4JLF9_BODSA|nr:Hypothetical protein, putative [Bodo saltans]|eukprot:CUG92355.1 Hypothetical protein, putative [Bodo saltans]